MDDKIYIGIDPGKMGFITTQKNGEFKHYSIADNDLYQLSDIMGKIKTDNGNVVCVMEEIHAILGSSAKATFSFGEIFGKLQALLVANKIPYHLVQPKEWQKEIWSNKDEVITYKTVIVKGKATSRKVVNTKATSINACKRLFPNMDLRRNAKCKKLDDNKVDSILLCEYGRRMNF